MKPLSEYIERPLRLVKKSLFSFEYDLTAGDEVLGTFNYRLIFNRGGVVKGLEKRNVEFYKNHFFSREIKIREEGKELPFASYKRDLISRIGNVFLPNGAKLIIHFGFFDVATQIKDANNKTLLLFKRASVFSKTLNVTIKEKSSLIDENPWIIFLTLFLLIKRRQRRQ
jgi:hypothetical protein